MKPFLLFLLIGCAGLGCRAHGGFVAAVERPGSLRLLEKINGAWHERAALPGSSRAFRCSPDGRRVAWVEDQAEGMKGSMEARELDAQGRFSSLGRLPAREREAFGLAVPDQGPARVLTDAGDHRHVIVTRDGWAMERGGCVDTNLRLHEEICGPALRPLDLRAGRLVARTNGELIVADAAKVHRRTLTDVLDARLGPDGRLLIVRRDSSGPRVEDVLFAGRWDGALTRWLAAPVLLRPAWLDDERVALIRAEGGAMENLLAHAPDEFGGEAIVGEAIVTDGRSTQTIDGLVDQAVRGLCVIE